jgi:hypothetical protein
MNFTLSRHAAGLRSLSLFVYRCSSPSKISILYFLTARNVGECWRWEDCWHWPLPSPAPHWRICVLKDLCIEGSVYWRICVLKVVCVVPPVRQRVWSRCPAVVVISSNTHTPVTNSTHEGRGLEWRRPYTSVPDGPPCIRSLKHRQCPADVELWSISGVIALAAGTPSAWREAAGYGPRRTRSTYYTPTTWRR